MILAPIEPALRGLENGRGFERQLDVVSRIMSGGKDRTIWTQDFQVRAYEADGAGVAHPAVLCNYLQEVAAGHAQALQVGTEHLGGGLAWVLSRLVLEVEVFPRWPDRVRLETWPSGVQGIFATRDFLMTSESGATLARATTAWFLIDVARRRPARLPEAVLSITLPVRNRALVDDFARIPPVSPDADTSILTAGRSDIDMNGHVNHVRYASWMLDTIDNTWAASHKLRRIQLQFRNEARLGENLSVSHERVPDDPFAWMHLVQSSQGGVVAQARSDWLPA